MKVIGEIGLGNWWNKVLIKVILRKSMGRRVSHED